MAAEPNADHSDGPSWREARAHKGEPATGILVTPSPSAAKEAPQRARRGKASREPTMVSHAPTLAVTDALREITSIPAVTLHHNAACTWVSRAIACYRVCLGKADLQEGLSYLYLGEHYREAALVHAQLGEAWQPMFEEIAALMDADRAAASAAMQGRSLAGVATP